MIRVGIPVTAILIPFAFFFSVLTPDAEEANSLLYLAYVGFGIFILTLLTLGNRVAEEKNELAISTVP